MSYLIREEHIKDFREHVLVQSQHGIITAFAKVRMSGNCIVLSDNVFITHIIISCLLVILYKQII